MLDLPYSQWPNYWVIYTDAFQQQGFLIGIRSKVLGLMIKTMCNPKNEYVGNKTPLSARSEV